MALPLLLIIPTLAVTGGTGVVSITQALSTNRTSNEINRTAQHTFEASKKRLNDYREACNTALRNLGEEKVYILDESIRTFIDLFSKIKNVSFKEIENLEETDRFKIDQASFEEMKEMVNFAGSIVKGTIAGSAGGALLALGSYGAAQSFAAASTGTLIASLSGAAATNATLAFFGGGSLAAGGLGMVGGSAVLGGIIAAPALLGLGLIMNADSKKKLEQAKVNQAEAEKIVMEYEEATVKCQQILRRTNTFYNLLARLDSYFLPMLYQMQDIIKTEGEDYRTYSPKSKKTIAAAVSLASTIKAILDTPILTEEGDLSRQSEKLAEQVKPAIQTYQN